MPGIKVGHNIESLTAQRHLGAASARLSDTFQKLSSGMRINKASDDAAGLAIASSLNADVRITAQAVRNVNDAISMANVAEGALSALKSITFRQRELATQAANGTYTLEQRQAMNAEANSLVEEYNRIVGSAEFNGRELFGNNSQGVRIQAGAGIDGSLLFGLGGGLSRNVGDGAFHERQEFDTGRNPQAVAIADVDNDGHLDVVTADLDGHSVSVLLGNGDGTFQAMRSFQTGIEPMSVAVADFNSDGNADLVTADSLGDTVSVFLGNGDGTFQAKRSFGTEMTPYSVAVGDFNGDGNVDLATADKEHSTSSVLLGNGDGTFQARRSFEMGYGSRFVAIGDLNGDGREDIVTADRYDDTVSVLLGNGDGTFRPRLWFETGEEPWSVAIGDLNGDGSEDIVTTNLDGHSISVLLGKGDGTFQARRSFDSGELPFAVAIGDVNGDGRADLVTANYQGDTASLLLGNGDGTFQASRAFEAGSKCSSVAIGDFNGDERADYVVAQGSFHGKVSVLLGSGPRVSTTQYLNLNTRQSALDAMSVIDGNLHRIQNELGLIGATTSRFSVALATLQARGENEAAASSRITDADIAQETAEMTKAQILQQVGAAVLAQANQAPRLALQLLG